MLHILSQRTDQVFIHTHSSVFVADNYPQQSLFKVEKTNGETEIELVTDFEKPYIVFDLLGGSPSDLLLPRKFIIVEGQSEFEFSTNTLPSGLYYFHIRIGNQRFTEKIIKL